MECEIQGGGEAGKGLECTFYSEHCEINIFQGSVQMEADSMLLWILLPIPWLKGYDAVHQNEISFCRLFR